MSNYFEMALAKVWRDKKDIQDDGLLGTEGPINQNLVPKKVCFNHQSLEKKKTSKMTACWEPEASCSLCNQTLEGHPEDYTMIFPPPAR